MFLFDSMYFFSFFSLSKVLTPFVSWFSLYGQPYVRGAAKCASGVKIRKLISSNSVKLHDKVQDSLHIPRTTLNGVVRTSNIQDEYDKYKYSRLYIILVNT